MTRVIAVQEEQLNLLKENYSKNVSITNIAPNNANILSESLGGTNENVSTNQLDMETQSVNLNAFSTQPINPVVSNETTNEVFGVPVGATSSNNFEPSFLSTSSENDGLKSEDLPYQEPSLGTSAPVNVMSDEAFVNYINSLRNMLSDFMNDMNSKLDKLQEEFLAKTGANLLATEQVGDIKDVEPIVVHPVESTISESVPVTNIFDPNETLVTNNLIQDINEARSMVESGFSKAA